MAKKILKLLFNKLGLQISRISHTSNNPEKLVSCKIGNYNILLNNSHALPGYLKQFPHYSQNLPRLSSKIKEKYQDLMIIDVGANIGDTVALVRSISYCPIICIEGDNYFFNILKKNIEQFKEVYAFQLFLGEHNNIISGKKESIKGTLKIVPSLQKDSKNDLQIITLDKFLDTNSKYRSAKLLKIDTDGFDLMIIKGSIDYLTKTKPILFFEYDKKLLEDVNENGISTLFFLKDIGYETAIFYDNFGRFLISTELKNEMQIQQLHDYTKHNKSAFSYYDICLFHQQDNQLAQDFIKEEMSFFKSVDY
ncbi:MAG: FkbM family methyltransferase [Bacteroidetes bacterium]|nr:FkbM family methyltransferase [Bacteroidota bacterium]